MKKRMLPLFCAIALLIGCGGVMMYDMAIPAGAVPPPLNPTVDIGGGRLLIQPCSDDIIRIRFAPDGIFRDKTINTYLDPDWDPSFAGYTVENIDVGPVMVVTTATLRVEIIKATGQVSFKDIDGNLILSERNRASSAVNLRATCPGPWFKVEQEFFSPADEALYGFGNLFGDDVKNAGLMNVHSPTQPQDVRMGIKGQTVTFQQNNVRKRTPMFYSNMGYGILFDVTSNGSLTWSADGGAANGVYKYTGNAADSLDYYFLNGPEADRVISGYRTVTGKAAMLPKSAFGYTQSRDRYASQTEIQNIVSGFRSRGIPLDTIVIDYQWWDNGPGDWTQSWFNNIMVWNNNWPNPTQMMNTLHNQNVNAAISVWPIFRKGTTTSDYILSQNPKFFIEDGANPVGEFAGHTMDVSSKANRDLYWKIIEEYVWKHGLDTIWLDANEPEFSDWSNNGGATNAFGDTRPVSMVYSLLTNQAVYEGQRGLAGNSKRVNSLSRNATAGGQRHGIQSWSGDIFANWQIFKSEIPGLINYSAAGLPYFSTDTGGYWPTNYGAALPSYNELFVRWLQFSAFSSIMRVHGNTNNREPWRFPANEQDIIIDYIKLRERLIPYIYALAGQVTQDDYTMIRPLVFDFPGDNSVMHITDQYMFGPAMMVAPVTTQGAQERNVYLPEGQWIDFWTGEVTDSFGETVMADAPLSKIPVFVRAGSVLPMGPHQQYANEKSDPLEIRVYMGANGSFKLYEDEGNSYNYEDDRFSVIPFSWNQAAKTLTIGARTGSFDGMLQNRTFNIVFVQPGYGTGLDPAKAFQKSVAYTGAAQTVVFDPDWTLPLPELDTNLIPRPAPAPSAVPDNAAGQSMVGEWKFEDGNITTMAWDTSGYANTGFFKGGAAFGDPRPGGAGAALSLDGSGGYMSVPHAPSLDMTTGVTGSLWVNWQKDNTDYWYFMINKSGNANNNPGYCFLLSPQGVPQVELQTAKNGSGQTVKKTVAAASSIPQNTWVHLAFSWQSQSAGGDGIVRIYRDGTLVSADSAANRFDGPVGTNTSDLHIGVTDDMELNGGGWANYFRGRVSEIRLFNFGVTGEDVTKIMNGQAVVIPGPVNIRTTPGDGKITVDWSVPAGVSANIKGYTLTVESVNGAYSKTYPDVLMPYELTGLTNGEYYRIALKTLYHDGKESQNAYAVGIASPYPAEIRRLLTHDNKAYGFIVNHGSDPVKGTLNIFVYRDGIPVKITQIPNFTLTGLETKLFDADIGGFGTGQYVQAVFDDGYGELLAVSKATERDRIWPLAEMSQEQLTGYLNTLLNLPAPPVTFAADSVDRYNGYAAGILAGDYGLHDAIELLRTTRHFPVYRFVPGNVSGTGTLNINDARMVLQHLVEKITLTGLPLQAADVDGNGKVDITDARLILQMLVQKITEFPRKD